MSMYDYEEEYPKIIKSCKRKFAFVPTKLKSGYI